MFGYTIDNLKRASLINESDIVVVCTETVSSFAYLGGAIGGAIAASKAKMFIMAVNTSEIRLFDIDKRSGEYMGSYSSLLRENVKNAAASGILGTKNIVIKANVGNVRLTAQNNIKGFRQKENIVALSQFFKANY